MKNSKNALGIKLPPPLLLMAKAVTFYWIQKTMSFHNEYTRLPLPPLCPWWQRWCHQRAKAMAIIGYKRQTLFCNEYTRLSLPPSLQLMAKTMTFYWVQETITFRNEYTRLSVPLMALSLPLKAKALAIYWIQNVTNILPRRLFRTEFFANLFYKNRNSVSLLSLPIKKIK